MKGTRHLVQYQSRGKRGDAAGGYLVEESCCLIGGFFVGQIEAGGD